MEDVKENISAIRFNIEEFSKLIGEKFNVGENEFRDYIFSNISSKIIDNKTIMKDFDKIYYEKKEIYYSKANTSSCINNVLVTQGTLYQEKQYRRILGILLVCEENYELRGKVIKLLRNQYSVIFNSVKKFNKEALRKKYLSMDVETRILEARFDGALYFYFAIYRAWDTIDREFLMSILNDMRSFYSRNFINADIDAEIQKNKNEIHEIKAEMKRLYGKLDGFRSVMQSKKPEISCFGRFFNELFSINKLDVNKLFQESEFLDVDKIILAYLKADKKKEEFLVESMVSGIFMQTLITQYKNSKKMYFEDTAESVLMKFSSLEDSYNELKSENEELKLRFELISDEKNQLDEEIESGINRISKVHKSEISILKNKIKQLEGERERENDYREELNLLREYIFKVSSEYIPNKSNENLEEYIKNKKVFIIGGAKEWRRRFREKYPEIRTFNGFNGNFETGVLMNADYVFFYTGYMNHATYYKVMNYLRVNGIGFGYIGKTNMDLVEEELIEELKLKGDKL